MKKTPAPTLSIEEFLRILESLSTHADAEHMAALQRLEELRAQSLPPG